MLQLKDGLKYPWGNPKRLWNILWFLIPILGFFAILGYVKKIVNSIVAGNTKELPEFGKFWDNFTTGFMLFIKLLPLGIAAMLIAKIPLLGPLVSFIFSLFLMPWLIINVLEKFTFAAAFEFDKAAKIVFNNLPEYILMLLKSLVYVIVYVLMMVILVGIPCAAFGRLIFLADFYSNTFPKKKKAVKKPTTKITTKKAVKKKPAKKRTKKKKK